MDFTTIMELVRNASLDALTVLVLVNAQLVALLTSLTQLTNATQDVSGDNSSVKVLATNVLHHARLAHHQLHAIHAHRLVS